MHFFFLAKAHWGKKRMRIILTSGRGPRFWMKYVLCPDHPVTVQWSMGLSENQRQTCGCLVAGSCQVCTELSALYSAVNIWEREHVTEVKASKSSLIVNLTKNKHFITGPSWHSMARAKCQCWNLPESVQLSRLQQWSKTFLHLLL